MFKQLKAFLRAKLPPRAYNFLRTVREWRDIPAYLAFLGNPRIGISPGRRWIMIRRLFKISVAVESPHSQREILEFVQTILELPKDVEGVLVEAGCFKGSSTAKFSLAAALADRELVVFDSFQGIPENDEPHSDNIFGGDAVFKKGDYAGSLEEVKATVARYGRIDCCRFIKGWFDETMQHFSEPVAAAYVDVDLVSSTRTCLQHLYPLLPPGGALYSQDGHLPLVIDLFQDEEFWRQQIGCEKPRMHGLGLSKLVRITKSGAGTLTHVP
jgi:O-methyltransferase